MSQSPPQKNLPENTQKNRIKRLQKRHRAPHARPCVGRTAARAWWHGRATRHGVAVPHFCGTALLPLFFYFFIIIFFLFIIYFFLLLLLVQGFLHPLFFLEFTLEVLFSVETQRFLLK